MKYSDRLYKIYCRDGSYFPSWEEVGEVYMSYAPAKDDFLDALRRISMWELHYPTFIVERPYGIMKPPFYLRSQKTATEFSFEAPK